MKRQAYANKKIIWISSTKRDNNIRNLIPNRLVIGRVNYEWMVGICERRSSSATYVRENMQTCRSVLCDTYYYFHPRYKNNKIYHVKLLLIYVTIEIIFPFKNIFGTWEYKLFPVYVFLYHIRKLCANPLVTSLTFTR